MSKIKLCLGSALLGVVHAYLIGLPMTFGRLAILTVVGGVLVIFGIKGNDVRS